MGNGNVRIYLFAGLSTVLQNIFKEEYISSRAHKILAGDILQGSENASFPTLVPTVDMEVDDPLPDVDREVKHLQPDVETEIEHLPPNIDTEIEHVRFEESSGERDFMSEFMASPSRRDEFTPIISKASSSGPPTISTFDTEVLPSLDQTTRTEPVGFFDIATPSIFSDQQQGLDVSAGYSDISGLLNSAEVSYLFPALV